MTYTFAYNYPVSSKLLEEYRITYAGRIPESYWSFVEKHGCGNLDPFLLFPSPWDEQVDGCEAFETVLGPCAEKGWQIEYVESYMMGVPRWLQRFGSTVNGELMFFDCRPESLGNVYMRGHNIPELEVPTLPLELFDGDEYEASIHHFIAPSFEAFLAMCKQADY
jgi:hypothetical protein